MKIKFSNKQEVYGYLEYTLGGWYGSYDIEGFIDEFFDKTADGGFECEENSDEFWTAIQKYDMGLDDE